jgi:hypothetical protein
MEELLIVLGKIVKVCFRLFFKLHRNSFLCNKMSFEQIYLEFLLIDKLNNSTLIQSLQTSIMACIIISNIPNKEFYEDKIAFIHRVSKEQNINLSFVCYKQLTTLYHGCSIVKKDEHQISFKM